MNLEAQGAGCCRWLRWDRVSLGEQGATQETNHTIVVGNNTAPHQSPFDTCWALPVLREVQRHTGGATPNCYHK